MRAHLGAQSAKVRGPVGTPGADGDVSGAQSARGCGGVRPGALLLSAAAGAAGCIRTDVRASAAVGCTYTASSAAADPWCSAQHGVEVLKEFPFVEELQMSQSGRQLDQSIADCGSSALNHTSNHVEQYLPLRGEIQVGTSKKIVECMVC